jgi:hypothetical protein
MRVTIEIPDVLEYNGKEYEATGEFRKVVMDEVVLFSDGHSLYSFTLTESARKHHVYKPKRWKAKEGGMYWHVASNGDGEREDEGGYMIDNERYELGNYFKTREEAEVMAEKVKELFKKEVR